LTAIPDTLQCICGRVRLRIAGAPAAFQHSTRQLKRHFCRHCGETLFGNNRLDMTVIPNSLFARAAHNTLPDALAPTMHPFYRRRVVDGWDGPSYEQV